MRKVGKKWNCTSTFANVLESEQLFLDNQVFKEATGGNVFLYNRKRFMKKTLERFM